MKDTIIGNEYTDLVLLRLVDLAITDVQGSRPLFSSLIEEPAFYRKHFRRWVREALEEKQSIDQGLERRPFEEEDGV